MEELCNEGRVDYDLKTNSLGTLLVQISGPSRVSQHLLKGKDPKHLHRTPSGV